MITIPMPALAKNHQKSMDHFSLLRGSSGSHSVWLWKCGKFSCKTSPEKVEVWKCRHWDISPKTGLVKDDHSPDAWKSGFVEAGQAEEERQRQMTQARQDAEAKVELILHLGISGTMLNIFLRFFESCHICDVIGYTGKHCSRPWRSKVFLSVFAVCCFVSFSEYM